MSDRLFLDDQEMQIIDDREAAPVIGMPEKALLDQGSIDGVDAGKCVDLFAGVAGAWVAVQTGGGDQGPVG